MKEFIPIIHRIVIKPDSIEDIDPTIAAAKRAGIELPPDSKNREQGGVTYGTVISVGSTCFVQLGGDPSLIKPGDRVLYAKHAGKTVSNPNNLEEKWLILNDEDVVGVIKDV